MRFEDASRPELLAACRALLEEGHQLRRRVTQLEELNKRLSRECAKAEQQNTTLTHLQVATRLLHRSCDRQRVIRSIHEIVVNLIGSEQLALFEVERGGLLHIGSFSFDGSLDAGPKLLVEDGPIAECARTGLLHVDPSPDPERPLACIPLKLDGQVMGVLVIFRLLSHKLTLEDVDYALFELLSSQAAVALKSSQLASVQS
jgi:nitrate/nitrite-specific signal transduction histidine kinase